MLRLDFPNPGYNGNTKGSFGEDDPQDMLGSRIITIPNKMFPTVVLNKLNPNMCVLFTCHKYPEDVEKWITYPESIPFEEGIYFEMIWKAY